MKTKAKKQSKKVVRKSSADPTAMAQVTKVMKVEMVKVKKGDITKCEAIRKVAKQLGKLRRVDIETALIKEFRMNRGTVRRQVQEGRA